MPETHKLEKQVRGRMTTELDRLKQRLEAPVAAGQPPQSADIAIALADCMTALNEVLAMLAAEIDALKDPKYWSRPVRMGD
jgi:hypothetical protein